MNIQEQLLAVGTIAISLAAWLISEWIKKQPPKCQHKWEVSGKTHIFQDGYERPVAARITLQCEHCGDIKIKKI